MTHTPAASHRPAGLDALLDHVAANVDTPEQQPTPDWVDDVRSALAFNESASHPAVITLRDVLLDDAPRTPEQALTAALILLATHTRELAQLAEKHTEETHERYGVTRSSRGLLTGMSNIRKLLDHHATTLDDQAGK